MSTKLPKFDGIAEAVGAPAAEYVDPKTLVPWKNNPRKNDGEPVSVVMKSIRRFGFGAPIVARLANREIIGGHTRLKAALKLKLKVVPCRFLDISEEEAHALALADNKTNELADWDKDLLAAVMGDLNAAGVDLTAGTGFDDAEVEKLLAHGDIPPDEYAGDDSDKMEDKFQVVVECEDERQQAMLLERLQGEGFEVRALVG